MQKGCRMYATIFLLIFAGLLMAYGLVMYLTGDVNMMPYRTRHSIHGKEDVRRVGLIVARIGGLLAVVLCIILFVMRVFVSG